MNTSLKHAFLKFLRRYHLVSPGQSVLVAVSGGIDSVVLLHLFWEWQPLLQLKLGVAHVHHGLRGAEADADAGFVKELAAALGLPFFLRKVDVPTFARNHRYSLEEAARILREAELKHIATQQGYDRIATAHHLKDQVETIFLRLLTGTGFEGLAGIRREKGPFIRPLLFAAKADIEAYARENKLAFRVDQTNKDLRYLRNRVRHRLLPYLEKEFHLHHWERFLNMAFVVDDWARYVEQQVEQAFRTQVKKVGQNKFHLELSIFRGYFTGIQIRLIERIVRELSSTEYRFHYRKFRDFLDWLERRRQGGRWQVAGGILARVSKDQLIFERVEKTRVVDLDVYPDREYTLPELNITFRCQQVDKEKVIFKDDQHMEFVDASRLTFPLRLRTWQAGDRFQPLGLSGSKLVSDFLQEQKAIGRGKRLRLVLLNGDEIVAVVGHRISERYKITPQTTRVLKLEIREL